MTGKKLLFRAYVEEWEEWERVSANQWSLKTYEGYASILRAHLLPAFGESDLKKISVLDVERYIADKVDSGLNSNSVKHHVVLLKTILNSALRQGIILQNPVQRARLPKVARYIPQTYVPEEIARFLNELKGTQYFAIMYVAFWTGARRGELLALRWSDVNLDRKLITIMKSKTVVTKRYDKGKVQGQTKTDPSVRVIAISDDLCGFLKRHKAEQEERRRAPSYEDKTGLVFTSHQYGRMLNSSYMTEKLNTIQKRLGLNHIRMHDARHTHASIALNNGVDLVTMSNRLGHSRVSTTDDYYSHVVPGADQQAADVYARAVNLEA